MCRAIRVLQVERPCRAPFRVTRGQASRQHGAAETNGVPILNTPIDMDRGEIEIRPEVVIAAAAPLDDRRVGFADDDLCAGELLHPRMRADMVEVRLRCE